MAGGHLDYLDDQVALLYPISGMERLPKDYRQFFLFDPAGQWGCPEPRGLRNSMRRAFDDRDHLASLAANSTARAADYAWPLVAERYVDAVESCRPH